MTDLRACSPSSDVFSDGVDSLSMRDKALLKRSASKHHNNNFKAGYVPVHEQYLHKTGLRGRKTIAFWTLVGLIFILAVGNLVLTVTILGVLRLGQGMQSMELISEQSAVKFYGNADLGYLYKRDGRIESFANAPMKINSQNGAILLNLTLRSGRPVNKLTLTKNGTSFTSFENFEVRTKANKIVFSTTMPHLNDIKRARNMYTRMAEVNRIVSPLDEMLKVESKNVNLKGAEGTLMESREIIWSADQDIYLKSINGSLVLSGKEGTFINIKRIPVVEPAQNSNNYVSSQFKVCVCMPQGKLFRIPVPSSPNARVYCNHINMSDKNNPCM